MVIRNLFSTGHGHRAHLLWTLVLFLSFTKTLTKIKHSNFTERSIDTISDINQAFYVKNLKISNEQGDKFGCAEKSDMEYLDFPVDYVDPTIFRNPLNMSVPRLMKELYSKTQKYDIPLSYDADIIRSYSPIKYSEFP